jgi:hypothetical protein
MLLTGGGGLRGGYSCAFSVVAVFGLASLPSFAPPPHPLTPSLTQVSNDFKKIVDADGDGKITKKDALVYYKKAKSFLTFNLPSSSGFGLGFLVGLAG